MPFFETSIETEARSRAPCVSFPSLRTAACASLGWSSWGATATDVRMLTPTMNLKGRVACPVIVVANLMRMAEGPQQPFGAIATVWDRNTAACAPRQSLGEIVPTAGLKGQPHTSHVDGSVFEAFGRKRAAT